MAKKNTKRKLVGMVSEESNGRTYYTTKNTQNTTEKLTLRKYDPALKSMLLTRKLKRILVVTKLSLAKSNLFLHFYIPALKRGFFVLKDFVHNV